LPLPPPAPAAAIFAITSRRRTHRHDTVEQALRDHRGDPVCDTTQGLFGLGIDDVVILPLVLTTLVAKKLLKAALSVLIHVLDYVFPILLQLMRFPLFTVRIGGDGMVALLKAVAACLPLSGTGRAAFDASVSRHWSWLRQKISYRAFEEAVHHAFEAGMAWVFRTCRTLTPLGALLVIAGALVWLPISMLAATAMHAVLIAKAAALPAWMQLMHPLATLIAKSKLLVLPAYPAAWPQAKRHPLLRKAFQFYREFTRLGPVRKTAYRYRQVEGAAAAAAQHVRRAVSRIGLDGVLAAAAAALAGAAAGLRQGARALTTRAVEYSSAVPLIGAILGGYAAHYGGAQEPSTEKLSQRMRGFFERWSIKFSAEYYEAKESAAAAREPAARDPQWQA
jgi:hypothetical protein